MPALERACRAPTTESGMRRLSTLALALLLAIVPASLSSGQSNDAASEDVTLEGNLSDVQFVAGRTVRIKANVSDDVFAAGRDVTFESATVKNAIAAGYDVEQRGGVVSDLIAAAANLTVAGIVEDDFVGVGRSIRIASDGTIGGDLRAAAETIEMEGHVNGSMRAAARRITISGEIDDKVDLVAERIVIAPGARIAGDLIYRSQAQPEIGEGATIGGEIRRVPIEAPDLKTLGLAILGIGILLAVSWALALLLLVVVVQLVFGRLTTDAAEDLWEHPWSNLGRGIAFSLIGTAIAGLLFASILGIPLGGALLMTIAVMMVLGLATVSYCIGLAIRRRRDSDIGTGGRVGWALLGTVILGLVTLIPFVGGLIAWLAVASGFGAVSAELWRRMRAA